MKVIADFHIHSKYARACSKDLNPENLAVWADRKGINILGTGDFTHPKWLEELKESLVEAEPGLYKLKTRNTSARFVITGELASVYKQGDKVRRVHNLVFAPNFKAADKLISLLTKRGANLRSDGRPIMGVPCEELVKICKDADEQIEVVPAHAWTPHFGVFGSLSGFDSLEEAYGSMTKHIFAIETGLSSDPKMNWQIPGLDNIALLSNSDAHSLRKLGREANVFEIAEKSLSYGEIIRVIKDRKPKEFLNTIEFFPEEGKYHLDGHADCKFSCSPDETRRLGGICPVCGKKLLKGVMYRVDELSAKTSANGSPRGHGFKPTRAVPFKSIVPLEDIIADVYGLASTSSKKVIAQYDDMVEHINEFELLLETSREVLAKLSSETIAESIIRVREGRLHLSGGYDGEFGKIQIYSKEEREKKSLKPKRNSLV